MDSVMQHLTESNTNGKNRAYSVAALGFQERERVLLRNILRISEQHPLEFRPYQPQRDDQPEIVIVNGDNPSAIAQWSKLELTGKSATRPMTPIYLARAQPPMGAQYHLGRPFLATRLFALLERVVTERHGYQPDPALMADDLLLLTDDKKPAPDIPMSPADAAAAPAAPRNALVVDDSLPVRIQLKAPMEKAFEHVDVAETGEEALDFLDTRVYDLILLDVILPGIDGYETCRRIKKHPQHGNTPVVMLTSNSSPADKVKGKLAGCETYLIKPVKADVFEQVLRGLIDTRAAA